MAIVTIQKGHVARTKGATGTHREQEFANALAPKVAEKLQRVGHQVNIIGADDKVPNGDVFVALHLDGSLDKKRRGASVGYPNEDGRKLAHAWKAAHQRAGYTGGFHTDNYTIGLSRYYGFRVSPARFEFVAEHGTSTNKDDEKWLFENLPSISAAHVDAIGAVVGHPQLPPVPVSWEDTVVDGAFHQGGGEWRLGPDGGVFAHGAPFYGSVPGLGFALSAPAMRIVPTKDGLGYYVLARDGGVFAFGSAAYRGSYPGLPAEARSGDRYFVDLVIHDDGQGYTLISNRARNTYSFR